MSSGYFGALIYSSIIPYLWCTRCRSLPLPLFLTLIVLPLAISVSGTAPPFLPSIPPSWFSRHRCLLLFDSLYYLPNHLDAQAQLQSIIPSGRLRRSPSPCLPVVVAANIVLNQILHLGESVPCDLCEPEWECSRAQRALYSTSKCDWKKKWNKRWQNMWPPPSSANHCHIPPRWENNASVI